MGGTHEGSYFSWGHVTRVSEESHLKPKLMVLSLES